MSKRWRLCEGSAQNCDSCLLFVKGNGPTVQRRLPVGSCQLAVAGGRGLRGAGKNRLLPEGWEFVPRNWNEPFTTGLFAPKGRS